MATQFTWGSSTPTSAALPASTGLVGSATPAPAPAPAPAPSTSGLLTNVQRQDIEQSYASLTALGSQSALNNYLATTPYTAAQLAAVTGYSEADLQTAINSARAANTTAQQWTPATTQQWGNYSQPMGGDPSTYNTLSPTSLNNFHMAQIGGYRGTYEEWASGYNQRKQNEYQQAQQEAAANPNVVVGGSTGTAASNLVPPTPAPAPAPASQNFNLNFGTAAGAGGLQSTDMTVFNATLAQLAQLGPAGIAQAQQAVAAQVDAATTYEAKQAALARLEAVKSYAAQMWQVTPDQTVRGQLEEILKEDGALMQQASSRAMQQMNARGLLNSSLAVGASQSALYDAAMPIATADAGTYANAARTNAQYKNEAERFNAEQANTSNRLAFTEGNATNKFNAAAENDAARFAAEQQNSNDRLNVQLQTQVNQANAAAQNSLKQAQLQAETSLKNAQISSQTTVQVAEMNRQYSQLASLSTTSSSLLTSYNSDINNIVLSDLPAAAKEAAINARTQTLRMSMNVIGAINGDVDMNKLLNQILG